jgi:predicted nucleic acid-binding protein
MQQRWYLDSNIFIYTLEGYADFADTLHQLALDIAEAKLDAVTSEISVAEVLVKPIAERDAQAQKNYTTALRNTDNFTVVPIDRDILLEAATIRAYNKLKLPDAIHFATACLNECTHFVTNDDHFKTVKSHPKIKVLLLQQLRHLQK